MNRHCSIFLHPQRLACTEQAVLHLCGLVASFVIGNVLLLILNLPLIGKWVRILTIPYRLLYPVILVLICFGVYAAGSNVYHVLQVCLSGLLGYLMIRVRLEAAPLLQGFVLGPLLEDNYRRAAPLRYSSSALSACICFGPASP